MAVEFTCSFYQTLTLCSVHRTPTATAESPSYRTLCHLYFWIAEPADITSARPPGKLQVASSLETARKA